KDNAFARQSCRPRKGESMGGFPLAAGRGSYAERGALPPPSKRSRSRAGDGKLDIGPGHTKCLGERRPIVIQNYVRGRSPSATDSSRRPADGQRPHLLLHLSASAEPLVPKFQEERKHAAE